MKLSDLPARVRQRFWSRVAVRSEDECWPFRLSLGSHGYGQIGWQEGDKNHMVLAHRVAWVLTMGEIPEGLTVDHQKDLGCAGGRCCNPKHLRLLTLSQNASDNGAKRRTHCPRNHPYDEANTYVSPLGHRRCRECARVADRARAR